MSVSYGIIKEHGGNIYALSEPGKGATFVIELPIMEVPLAVELKEKATKEIVSSFKASILVVDDEESILDLLYDFLKEKGYQVDTANTGQEALRKLKTETYDLIICELKMPNLSGPQLFDEINKTRPELSSRIIFFTGDTESLQTESFVKRTGNKVISKPFDLDWLLSFIQEFLVSQSELKVK